MVLYSKHIYLEQEAIDGFLFIENGRIEEISCEWKGEYIDYAESIIIPGFIDNHIHGFATGSFWLEKTRGSVIEMQKVLPRMGVTSFLPTTGADSIESIEESIKITASVMKEEPEGAQILGIHLEGPFLNKEYGGMQDLSHCVDPDIRVMERFYQAAEEPGIIKLMTMAVELEGAKEVLDYCREHGIQVSAGHSGASFEEISRLKQYGIGGVTHMFSGMRGIHHRELGIAGAALYYDDLYCEFAKQTGRTVCHEAFELAYRIKTSGRIILTTDCVGLGQAKEPRYHYIQKAAFQNCADGLHVAYDNGEEKLLNPKLYEDVKDLEMGYLDSVINMKRHTRADMFDIISMTSKNPAQYIGIYHKTGSIAKGKDADLLVLSPDMDLLQVYCRGKKQLEK